MGMPWLIGCRPTHSALPPVHERSTKIPMLMLTRPSYRLKAVPTPRWDTRVWRYAGVGVPTPATVTWAARISDFLLRRQLIAVLAESNPIQALARGDVQRAAFVAAAEADVGRDFGLDVGEFLAGR
jgi:hypothetical protein